MRNGPRFQLFLCCSQLSGKRGQATARRQGRQHQKPRLRVFKGPFMDRGMPDFTGKLKEDDVAKIQAFILTCFSCSPYSPASIRLNSSSPSSNICCELPNQETPKPVGGGRRSHQPLRQRRMRQLSSGICWSGLRVNCSGSFVQALQMYSSFLA